MKTLAWLCDDDRNPIDDTPLCTLDINIISYIDTDSNCFYHEGKKYSYYGTIDG